MLFKTKNSYTYTDNFGKRHKLKISDSEVICAPYNILPTGNMALQEQGICKAMFPVGSIRTWNFAVKVFSVNVMSHYCREH